MGHLPDIAARSRWRAILKVREISGHSSYPQRTAHILVSVLTEVEKEKP
jgi:hypothetical protein